MSGKRKKSSRAVAMSQAMKSIKKSNPEMPQTQVLSMASKQMSGQRKQGGILPLLPIALSALGGYALPKLMSAFTGSGVSNKGRGLNLAPARGSGMYLKPYR
jgi:hypothetical protein